MSRQEVREVVEQRVKMIQTMAPGMLIRSDIEEEDGEEYGLITTVDQNSGLKGLDFVETETSWHRQNAFDQYIQAAMEGFRVTVIVPDSAYDGLRSRLSRERGMAIVLNSYGELGIRVRA